MKNPFKLPLDMQWWPDLVAPALIGAVAAVPFYFLLHWIGWL